MTPTEGIGRGRRKVRRRRHTGSPSTATFLSFLWPGLGNAYVRQRRRAFLFALPPLLLLIGTAVLIAQDPTTFALSLLAPSFALVVIGAIAVHGLWRVLAILDAWRMTRAGTGRLSDRHLPLAILLSVVVIVGHVSAGVFVQSFADAGEKIFTGDKPGGDSDIDGILGGGPLPPAGGALPGDTNGDGVVDWNDEGWIEDEEEIPPEGEGEGEEEPSQEPGPSFDPDLSPPPLDDPTGQPDPVGSLPSEGPINILFIGLDSGLGRTHSLSDTLLVASYFPERDQVTLISIPRDTGRMPLYTGGTYPRRINTFLGYARSNPHLFPEGPVAALMKQVGYLLGTHIHFYAATNLEGLPKAVDAVGGVEVVLDRPIADPKWNLYVEPGRHYLDGRTVMPVVRSRYGPGNSDWQRARRQQQVIRGLAASVRDPSVAMRLPQVVNALTEVVRTNVPRDKTMTLHRILERANDASAHHVVLSPSRYARRVTGIHFYMTELNMAAVRELSLNVFGAYSRYP